VKLKKSTFFSFFLTPNSLGGTKIKKKEIQQFAQQKF
jgi:hypothetical protein